MSHDYPVDTRSQRILEELYEKEKMTQLTVFLRNITGSKHKANILKPLKQTKKAPVAQQFRKFLKSQHSAEVDTKPQDSDPMSVYSDARILGVKVEPDMYVPDVTEATLLYDGISKEGKGRSTPIDSRAYLNARSRTDVEDRYRHPILSSMEYGWRWKTMKEAYRPVLEKGRSNVIEESFYRRNGTALRHGEDML